MIIDYHQIIAMLSNFIWPLFRMSGLMLTLPVFSSSSVSTRVKIMIIFVLSVFCANIQTSNPSLETVGFSVVYIVAQEILLGALIGFIFQLVLQAFIIAGQVIAMQMGLGFATMVDPASKANVPLVSQFYLMMVTLLFLSFNGHLIVLELMMQSYKRMPVADFYFQPAMLWQVVTFSLWMFKGGVLVALPAITSLLMVNMSFGVMTKAAPQINIFSIGFPLTLMMGIGIIYLTTAGVLPQVELLLDKGLILAREILR